MTPTVAQPSRPDPDLPPPAPITAERLEEASRGWVQGWTDGRPAVQPSSCVLRQLNRASAGDQAGGDVWFRSGDRLTARVSRRRFETPAEAGRTMFVVQEAIETCDDDGETIFLGYPVGTEVRAINFGTGSRRGTAWFVLTGNRLAVFTVAGSAASSRDANSIRDIADVLVADLQAW